MSKATDKQTERALKVRDHENSQHTVICVAELDSDGKPVIRQLASIYVLHSATGGRVRAAIYDPARDRENRWQFGEASGYGYDKLASAIEGMTINGKAIGDHCDGKKRPTVRQMCDLYGWEIIGGHVNL